VPLLLAGCGTGDPDPGRLRLGYFVNLTHAVPIMGLEEGVYARRLPGVEVEEREFVSGPEAITSLLAGSLDATYAGPGPVITAASRAPGRIRIVAGAGDAGAILIARRGSGVGAVADLHDRTVAIPAFGNTQDLTLRLLMHRAGLRTRAAGGDVNLIKVRNADLATAFDRGQLDAALVPEPWGTALVDSGRAEIVLDSEDVLNGGRYPTTVLVVTERFARERPDQLRALLAANCDAVRRARRRPEAVVREFESIVKDVAGVAPSRATLRTAVSRLRITSAVDRAGLRLMIEAAALSGYLTEPVGIPDVIEPGAFQPCPGDGAAGAQT
jgi:NitT/TauT family transport system substrate-binding protein